MIKIDLSFWILVEEELKERNGLTVSILSLISIVLEGVSVLFYVISLSEFNENLTEDQDVNRMKDSMQTFEKTIKSSTSLKKIILIFNKRDVLEEKLKTIKFAKFFPSFKKEQSLENVIGFLKEEFLNLVKLDKSTTVVEYITEAINYKTIIPLFHETIKKFF